MPAQTTLTSGIDGRGVIWYELDELRRDEEEEPQGDIPSTLQVPQDVIKDINVFGYGDGEPGLTGDWVFYAAAVASGVAVKFWLTATASAGNFSPETRLREASECKSLCRPNVFARKSCLRIQMTTQDRSQFSSDNILFCEYRRNMPRLKTGT